MLQGKTARTMVVLLAAVLICLPFSALTTSLASAPKPHHTKVSTEPGNVVTGKALRDEVVTHRKRDHSGDPVSPLPWTDRYRTADPVPPAPERPLLEEDPASAHEPVARVTPHHRTARSQPAHTPAALQVFRC